MRDQLRRACIVEISENPNYTSMTSSVYQKILNYLRMRSWLCKHRGKDVSLFSCYFFRDTILFYNNRLLKYSQDTNRDECIKKVLANIFNCLLRIFIARLF